jgi:hypothetical protein
LRLPERVASSIIPISTRDNESFRVQVKLGDLLHLFV